MKMNTIHNPVQACFAEIVAAFCDSTYMSGPISEWQIKRDNGDYSVFL